MNTIDQLGEHSSTSSEISAIVMVAFPDRRSLSGARRKIEAQRDRRHVDWLRREEAAREVGDVRLWSPCYRSIEALVAIARAALQWLVQLFPIASRASRSRM
jgi:hypothetical protein